MTNPDFTDEIIDCSPTDPRAQPLVEDLIHEYDSRYGTVFNDGGATAELYRYPPEAFAPPVGAFILLLRGGQAVAGGAFMRWDEQTAEFKRIWTRRDLRRQGVARRIVAALEERAAAQGYSRIYLTTGFRQPEAVALYLNFGYRPLFRPDLDPALYMSLPFEKHVGAMAGFPGVTPLKEPDPELAKRVRAAISELEGAYQAALAS